MNYIDRIKITLILTVYFHNQIPVTFKKRFTETKLIEVIAQLK